MRKQDAVEKKKLRLSGGRRMRRRMVAIMAEETRRDVRKRFREATAISVAWDVSDGRKIVRARCDTPCPPYRFDCVLGVMTSSTGSFQGVADEVSEDHAKVTQQYLQKFHERFFTESDVKHYAYTKRAKRQHAGASGTARPQGSASQPVVDSSLRRAQGAETLDEELSRRRRKLREGRTQKRQRDATLDEEALKAYRRKVRVLASDGGPSERRALFLAATCGFFPNVSFTVKDMAHCLRIATQKPMQFVSIYEDVYCEIIDKRHALIPDIQNSTKFRNMLEAIQVELLQMPGMKTQGALKVVLAHLAFAKQRMDSCADPLAKVALMLLPIGVLLSFISSDERHPPWQRDGAAKLLSKMQPLFLHALGVAADWGMICLHFLRLFDSGDHDISNSTEEEENFRETIRAVFVDGGLFTSGSHAPATGGADGAAEFITSRVRRQTKQKCVMRCGAKQTVVWGPIGESDLQELAVSTRVAARTMLERVQADMAGIRQYFQCFSLRRVDIALGGDAARGAAMSEKLFSAVRSLGRNFRIDSRMLVLEYGDSLPVMRRIWQASTSPADRASASFPNRTIWVKLLDNEFVEREFPGRAARFLGLREMIRIWVALLDGESMVERDFAHARAFVRSFKTASGTLLDDMIVLKLSGPQKPHELVVKSASGDLFPTEFLTRCVNKWRSLYGAKHYRNPNMYRPGLERASRSRTLRKPTFIDAKRGVLRAARRVVAAGRTVSPSAPERSAYAVAPDFFRAPRGERNEETQVWNERLKRFSALSKTKKLQNEKAQNGRHVIPKWKPRLGRASLASHPTFQRIAFLPDCDAAACGAATKESFKEMGYSTLLGEHRCNKAQLVIVDSLERLSGSCPDEDWVIHATYIVAKGIMVATAAACQDAGGDPRKIRQSHFIQHIPATEQPVEFDFDEAFKRRHREVVEAVHECLGGRWTVKKKKGKQTATTARGGAPACGGAITDSLGSPAPASGAQTRGRGKKQLMVVPVGTLEHMWQLLQGLKKIKNSRGASVIWRNGLAIM